MYVCMCYIYVQEWFKVRMYNRLSEYLCIHTVHTYMHSYIHKPILFTYIHVAQVALSMAITPWLEGIHIHSYTITNVNINNNVCMYVCMVTGLGTKIAARMESSQGSISISCMYVCMYV